MNKVDFENIIEKINHIWLTKYIRCKSNISEVAYNLAKDINTIKEITNVTLGKASQLNYKDFDGDANFIFEYPILIEINNIKLNGKIRFISANDSGYNVTLCISNDPRILESNQSNKFSIKSFIQELKQCKSFEDIKHVFKKYAVEAITIGTLLTTVLCNFNLTDYQIRELGYINDSNVVPADQFYVQDDEISAEEFYGLNKKKKENKPEWKLLCSDVETTVYHAKESQCNSDVQNTASMFKLNLTNPESHKIIAMERTMMQQYGLKYGDLVKIEGTNSRDGVYQIQDTMNKRFAGKHKIDILINNKSKIEKWDNVKIYKLLNPKQFSNSFKEHMANALNQKWIDSKQNNNNL